MLKTVLSNFRHPRGFIGQVTGWIMAIEDRERIAWTVRLLNVQPGDHILEIGFGPGVGIKRLAARTKAGFIAGVDPSDVMVGQASQRNAAALKTGRVALNLGVVERLPYGEQQFDKVFTINSFHTWTDALSGLHEVQRVLKPGGIIAIVEQPPSRVSEETEIRQRGDIIRKAFSKAGFQNIELIYQDLKLGWAVLVRGEK